MKFFAIAGSTVLAVGLLLAADDPGAEAPAAREGDEKAIRALLAQLGEAWNQHDVKTFVAGVSEDADVVNRFGQWMKSRAEIEKHLTELHASPIRDFLVDRSTQVEQVRFLTADVVLVHERAKEQAGQSVRTYVLQKRDGRWWVQSAGITQVSTPQAK
jgi:uncharacterized protein (TIGR02246 family)